MVINKYGGMMINREKPKSRRKPVRVPDRPPRISLVVTRGGAVNPIHRFWPPELCRATIPESKQEYDIRHDLKVHYELLKTSSFTWPPSLLLGHKTSLLM